MTEVAHNVVAECVNYMDAKHPDTLQEDNEKILKSEILQLKNILATLTMKYKIAEDSRKVMTRRNSILFDDNQFLQDKLLDVEGRRILAEKEAYDMEQQVKKLEEALKMFMNEGRDGVKKILKSDQAVVSTSTTDLVSSSSSFCLNCSSKKDSNDQKPPIGLVISRDDIQKIDEDMMELKGAIQKREEACTKIWERDRNNRNKILKLNQEIQNLKNLNAWKSNELDFRTRELKIKEIELNEARRELLRHQGKNGSKQSKSKTNGSRRKPAEAVNKQPIPQQPTKQPVAKYPANLQFKRN